LADRVEQALKAVSSTPARVHGLKGKGAIEVGADADLVLLDADDLHVRSVVARGRLLLEEGVPLVRGTFDRGG
jgi:beta-aspartyl-dipeptidase (metallo-type)